MRHNLPQRRASLCPAPCLLSSSFTTGLDFFSAHDWQFFYHSKSGTGFNHHIGSASVVRRCTVAVGTVNQEESMKCASYRS